MNMGEYYSSADFTADSVLPVPLAMITNEAMCNKFSYGEVILYSLIKYRMRLSKANFSEFEDERGLFVIYKQETLAEMLHKDVRSVRRWFKSLKDAGWILVVQDVPAKPAKIYLKNITEIKEECGFMADKNALLGGQKCPADGGQKCPPNNKDIENKDIESKEYRDTRFKPPTLNEVKQYVLENSLRYVNPEVFYNYYEANGWTVRGRKMKKWKAACAGWNAREASKHKIVPINGYGTMESEF